jgi:hypothetical protein
LILGHTQDILRPIKAWEGGNKKMCIFDRPAYYVKRLNKEIEKKTLPPPTYANSKAYLEKLVAAAKSIREYESLKREEARPE